MWRPVSISYGIKGLTFVFLRLKRLKTDEEIYPGLVEEGYRVIMYDRRGYGQSEKGPGFMDFYVSDHYRPESVEEMAVLSACGHNTYQYRPEEYVRIVLDFVHRHA